MSSTSTSMRLIWARARAFSPRPFHHNDNYHSVASCRCYCEFRFDRVVIGLDILTFFWNAAGVGIFPGSFLDERKKSFLPIRHESVEIVSTQDSRVNQVRGEVKIQFLRINRRRGVVSLL